MTRDRQPTTKPKMKGIVSFFSVLLKEKKRRFSDLIHNFHKLVSSQHLCHHLDSQKILQSGRSLREEQEEGKLNLQSSVNTADIQVNPSDFHYLKVIGKGSFGKVLLARHRASGAYYAVKILQKKDILRRKEQSHVMVERSVLLKGLQHPFLVGLHLSFQTTNALYFVLDYLNGGELFYHLQREVSFPETRARFYAAEMASALGYLHSLKIVYRDLKPENVLLDSGGHLMLTDFGLCKEGVDIGDTMQTFCGTPQYSAPEVLRGHVYTPTVDWWSLGCVLFEMLYGLPPFYSRSKAQMYDNILHAPLLLGPGVSRAARSLLRGLLERDCGNRIGHKCDFEELRSHPFFLSINWDDLLAKKVTPPFIPSVAGPWDVRYIDPVFTLEPLPASVGLSDRYLGGGATESFLGFSYIPPVVTEPLPLISTHHKL